MAKPAEVKKRARRLAQEGKIVDAIAALEELAQSGSTDPYDLVALGDLCVRGGRTFDATDYYEQAVHAYRDSHLNRNAIALCRKVLRTHPDESRFTFLLAQMSEREGMTLDAVDGYLDFAQSLDSSEPPPDMTWLDALARLTPKNVDTLTRQAEVLVEWGRADQAVSLLRAGASASNGNADRLTLLELAQQMSELQALDNPESADDDRARTPKVETFDNAYLRALDLGTGDTPAEPDSIDLDGAAADESLVEHLHRPAASTEDATQAVAETPAPVVELDGAPDDVPGLEMSPEPSTSEMSIDVVLDEAASSVTEIEEPEAPVYEISLDETEDLVEFGLGEPTAAEATQVEAPSTEPTLDELRHALQLSVQRDPDNVATLEKLLEVYLRAGDSLSATDLRERMAHALLMKGDSGGALTQYAEILSADPMRQDIRTRHDRLSSELGVSAEPADASPSAKPGSLFNVKGLAKVEVKEDAAVSEDDMVDLGSLLDEFRAGLEEGMAGASPQAHYDLGLSHMEMHLYEEAAQSFEKATADPNIGAECREMWGRCLRELGRDDQAVRVLRAGLAERPESLGIRYQLARALESEGEANDARALFASIVHVDPNFEDAPQRLAALGDSDCPPQARTA